MTFYIQDTEFNHDFIYELYNAKMYWDWRNQGKSSEEQTNIFIFKEGEIDENHVLDKSNVVCPIGSVEFVTDFIKTKYGISIKPKNIPDPLKQFFPGKITYKKAGEEISFNYDCFVKSEDVIKHKINSIHYKDENPITFDTNVVITEWIPNIISEWRCFVYRNNLIDARPYKYDEDPFASPSINMVYKMIDAYRNEAPIAYTLDVGYTENGKTIIMEVHDFFSCGLYGFSDNEKLPFMLWKWFNEFLSKNNLR